MTWRAGCAPRNPNALAACRLPLDTVIETVRKGNNDVGGALRARVPGARPRLREGIAYVERLVLRSEAGTPVLIKAVATVALGVRH